MKSIQELYQERLTRIMAAVTLGTPDRVPVVPLGEAFCAKHQGVKLSTFCTTPALSTEVMLKSFTSLGPIDGIQHTGFFVHNLSAIWLSKVKIYEDSLWQVQEEELMKPEDYDTIIQKGFNAFLQDFYLNRLDDLGAKLGPFYASVPPSFEAAKAMGVVPFSPMLFTIPYEMFCGGRSMTRFMGDMRKTPEKVKDAMDAAMPDILGGIAGAIGAFKPIGVWVGGWRSASEFISPALWQKFVFPYIKQVVEAVVAAGAVPVLHLDSNWDRDVECFRDLPKAKCVFSPDGMTDIYRVKKLLGDHMCIMGDVHASMLSLGSPDEVYNYSTKLIKDLGPSGFILAQGCDIPPNAKPKNVAAMISAATGC